MSKASDILNQHMRENKIILSSQRYDEIAKAIEVKSKDYLFAEYNVIKDWLNKEIERPKFKEQTLF